MPTLHLTTLYRNSGQPLYRGQDPGSLTNDHQGREDTWFLRTSQAHLAHLSEVSPLANIDSLVGLPGCGLGGSGAEAEDSPTSPEHRDQPPHHVLHRQAGRMDRGTARGQFVVQEQTGPWKVPQA